MIRRITATVAVSVGIFGSVFSADAATTTFASYLPLGAATNLRYQQVGLDDGNLYTTTSANGLMPGAVGTQFSFADPILGALGVLDASFSLFAIARDNAAQSVAGFLVQSIDSGNFSFKYTGLTPLTVGSMTFTTGANLLSGTFTKGSIFGTTNGTSGSLFASSPDSDVVFSSDFLTFDPDSLKDLSLALTSITPELVRAGPNSSVGTFRSNSAGAFSTEVLPNPPVLPEPEVWGLFVVGLGLVGSRMRRRRLGPFVAA